jgi:hypothetical protein
LILLEDIGKRRSLGESVLLGEKIDGGEEEEEERMVAIAEEENRASISITLKFYTILCGSSY